MVGKCSLLEHVAASNAIRNSRVSKIDDASTAVEIEIDPPNVGLNSSPESNVNADSVKESEPSVAVLIAHRPSEIYEFPQGLALCICVPRRWPPDATHGARPRVYRAVDQ